MTNDKDLKDEKVLEEEKSAREAEEKAAEANKEAAAEHEKEAEKHTNNK
ncbi:MAG: hypothetical protein WC467_02320 [Patescibacteria group bacterium]